MIDRKYEIISIHHQGTKTITYRGIRLLDQLQVILKTTVSDYPSRQALAELQHEYGIMQGLSHPGIIVALELIKQKNRAYLVLEEEVGTSLKEWLYHSPQSPVTMEVFYTIALQLCDILSAIHNQQIIHKDIKPDNILINPETLEVKVIDFGISARLSFESVGLANPTIIEGSLPYISPEQTGRMNRLIDFRTDFYSLGITFYEVLAGHLPFQQSDLLELIYAHLALTPTAIDEVNPMVPKALAQIVAKLCSKASEERYSSAASLKNDLLQSRQLWWEGKKEGQFPLDQKKLKARLEIPQKLYGREEQIVQLQEIFEEVYKTNTSQLVLLAGAGGVGKSVFIQEIYKPLSRLKGYFMRGKFDLLQRNVSYFGLINAFKELINYILCEPESVLTAINE
jgi:serine/threonine protein kinase